MSVFLTISLITINFVNAQTYNADDTTIIGTQYTEMFKNYFGENKDYKYFTYKCNYNNNSRNCYYAIDEDNNYIRVTYQNDAYSYTPKIETGTDNDFNVNGLYFEVHKSYTFIILCSIAFMFCLYIVSLLLG